MKSFNTRPLSSESRRGRAGTVIVSLGAAALVAAAAISMADRSEGNEELFQTPQERAEIAAASEAEPAPRADAVNPLGVYELVRAIPFELEESYTHYYRAEQPAIQRGWILAIRVNVDLVKPTNQAQPVLYADLPSGTQTVERFNQGHRDGVVIAFLPETDASAPLDAAALANVDIWFGAAELSERLTAPMIATERERASSAGVFQLSSAASRADNVVAPIAIHDRTALEETAAELVIELAPGEADFASGYLTPR